MSTACRIPEKFNYQLFQVYPKYFYVTQLKLLTRKEGFLNIFYIFIFISHTLQMRKLRHKEFG